MQGVLLTRLCQAMQSYIIMRGRSAAFFMEMVHTTV